MKHCILYIAALMGIAIHAHATTSVSGGIFSNTTWTRANSPYLVTDTVVVFPGVTLTIQPGVTVQFAAGKLLEVRNAKIIAVGTVTDTITFTSASPSGPGSWGSVYIHNMNSFPAGPFYKQEFTYCKFNYAEHGLRLSGGDTVRVSKSLFQYNRSGIHGYQTANGATCAIDSCTFSYNICGLGSFDFNNPYGNPISGRPITNCTFVNNQKAGAIIVYSRMINCKVMHNEIGVWERGQSWIANNAIDSNTNVGLVLNEELHDTISNCTMQYNGIGLMTVYAIALPASQRTVIKNNIIAYDSIGILLTHTGDSIFCNSICANTQYAIKYTSAAACNSGIRNNNFCTPDSASTEAVIYSAYDNPNAGILKFMPLDTLCPPHITVVPVNPPLAVASNIRNAVLIYPNPFATELIIRRNEPFYDASVTIRNMLGQKVFEAKSLSGQQLTIRRGNLPDGIFFLDVTEEGRLITQQKVMISN